MSDPADAARRDAFEEDVRKALFRPGGELQRLKFRVMGFTLGLVLIALLAPTWLTRDRSREGLTDVASGVWLAGLMGGLGTFLVLAYVSLAVGLLVLSPETTSAMVAAIAGLAVTLIVLVNKPEDTRRVDIEWTSAPFVAMLLWLIAIILSVIARRSTRP